MTIRQQYARARKNALARVRAAEKKGFIVPENLVPHIPKRPTQASINRLNKLKANEIYKRSNFAGEETEGEVVSGKKGSKIVKERQKKERAQRKIEREEAKKRQEEEANRKKEYDKVRSPEPGKIDLSEIIIQNFFNELMDFPKSPFRDLIKRVILDEIKKHGKKEVADSLLACAEGGYYPQRANMYSREEASQMMHYFLEHLPGEGKMYADDLLDDLEWYLFKARGFEELEDWEDMRNE